MDQPTTTPEAPPAAVGSGLSLEGFHRTVVLPSAAARPWRQYLAFAGPALLVSVGYMDPGNWGTDLQAGAQFKYGLLFVVGLASLMAIFMQVISARLGVVTGKDLAQCCRDWYPRWTRWPNWLLSELAVAACDLAEVLGGAVALNLGQMLGGERAVSLRDFRVAFLVAGALAIAAALSFRRLNADAGEEVSGHRARRGAP